MRAILRSVWEEPRAPGAPGPMGRDRVLVAALIPAAVLEGIFRSHLPDRALSVVVTVVLAVILPWRRTRPLAAVVAVFVPLGVLSAATAGAAPQTYTTAYAILLPYALLRWGSGREIVAGAAVLIARGALSATPGASRTSNVAFGIAVFVAAMALGAPRTGWIPALA